HDFGVNRNFYVGGDTDGPIIGGFNTTTLGQHKDDHILRSIRVHRPEPDRQHELVGRVADLNWAQKVVAELGLFFEIHTSNEELHVLSDVGAEYGSSIRRDVIPTFAKPGGESITLRGGEDQNVVLPYRIFSFDLDT